MTIGSPSPPSSQARAKAKLAIGTSDFAAVRVRVPSPGPSGCRSLCGDVGRAQAAVREHLGGVSYLSSRFSTRQSAPRWAGNERAGIRAQIGVGHPPFADVLNPMLATGWYLHRMVQADGQHVARLFAVRGVVDPIYFDLK